MKKIPERKLGFSYLLSSVSLSGVWVSSFVLTFTPKSDVLDASVPEGFEEALVGEEGLLDFDAAGELRCGLVLTTVDLFFEFARARRLKPSLLRFCI